MDKHLISAEPAKHQLTWAIYINKNYRPITNAQVVENVGEGQKIVSISEIKVYDKRWSKKNVVVTPVEQEDGSFLIDFGDNLNEQTASFTVTTELTDEEIAAWEENSDKIYKNSVTITSDQQGSITDTANGKCKWKEDVLEKVGSVDKKNKNIVYTININQQQQVLPENLQIRDILGKNLVVNPESVELYIGSVTSNGTVVSTGQLETGYTAKIVNEGDNQVLVITLPNKSDNRSVYILKYTANPDEIFDGGDYTNIVRLLGYGYTNSTKDRVSFSYKAFGGGWVDKVTKPTTDTDITNGNDPQGNTNPSDNTDTPSGNTNPPANPSDNTGNNSGSNSNTGNSNSGSTGGSKTGTPSRSSSSSSSSQSSAVPAETVINSNADTGIITIPDEKTALAGPKKSGDVAGYGEKNIKAGDKLAKTGGFLGTAIAYIAGIVLILIGCVLIRGQKKFGEEK